jgi:hypothetical protein
LESKLDISAILPKISLMSKDEQRDFLKLIEELEEAKAREQAKVKFLPFVRAMWPGFIQGPHHEIMAEAFERVMDGSCKRLIINMPPRHTKSEFASFLLPAWFMGRFPEKKIIQATHTAELAVSFGRKTRNVIDGDDYKNIFSEVKLQSDSKAAGRWNTSKGGAYFAVGVGGAIAGKGADLFIIDDPHTEQDAMAAIGDAGVYDKVFDWYTSGPRQRLQPDARIVIVMCMTGDTPVLMADKTEKPLRDIRPGDLVATYEDGAITTANVANWKSSGVDSVFTIQTQSGRMIRANERHPFLVDFDGERKWIRLRDLRPGMLLVATKDAACQAKASYHKKNPDAPHRPIGFHGKWKGKQCSCGKPVHSRGMCISCYNKQYDAPERTPEERRASRIKHRYGITADQYFEMVNARNNLCDVCRQPPSQENTRAHWGGKLCIDHCHKTGKVRGLLCNNCNLAVGYGKTPENLNRAAEYLQRNT